MAAAEKPRRCHHERRQAGETLRLEELAADGFAQRMRIRHGGKATTCGCRCSAPIRPPTPCSPRVSPSRRASRPIACSPRSRRCRASKGASRSPARRAAAWSSSTMRTSPKHWPLRSMRCARSRRAGSCACSAAAATATRASVRSWARSPPRRPTRVIVTDDNPRSEKPEAIRAEILAGAPSAHARSATAPRPSAPPCAGSAKGDVLLVAGKGHETGQIVGSKVLPFSDHEAVRAALAEAPIHG